MTEDTAIETIEGTVEGARVPLPHSGGAMLRDFIAAEERMNDELAAIAADRRELRKEVKARGFDLTAYREVLRRRKLTAHERAELDCLTDLYECAIGDLPMGAIDGGELGTPRLAAPAGKAGVARVEADAWAAGLGRD